MSRLVLAGIVFALVLPMFANAATITVKSGTLPFGRNDLSCAANPATGRIYCFGGYYAAGFSSSYVNQIFEYNPATDTTVVKSAVLPDGRSGLSCVAYAPTSKIYCFGGYPSDVYGNEVLEYTPATDTIVVKSATIATPVSINQLSCALNPSTNRIYCFGGYEYGPTILTRIFEYNPATNTTTVKSATLPSGRWAHSCATDYSTNKIYCFGGYTGTTMGNGSYLTQIVEYSPATDTIAIKSSVVPAGRAYFSCVGMSGMNSITCYGGYNGGVTNQIIDYTPSTNTLGINPLVLPSARSGLACAVNPLTNKTYCFGGQSSGSYFNQIVEHAPDLPPSCSVTADNNPIAYNATTTLRWSSTSAAGFFISNVGYVTPNISNSAIVGPLASTAYNGTATSTLGSTPCNFTLAVTPPPAPTCSLTATPPTLTSGQSSTLTWSSTNASTASINQGVGSVPTQSESGSSQTFNVSGNFMVPSYDTLTVQVWGGGGGGAGKNSLGIYSGAVLAGSAGQQSSFNATVLGNGGSGAPGLPYDSGSIATGGAGGSASGGTTNTTGNAGLPPTAGGYGGAGGSAPNGGAGGAGGPQADPWVTLSGSPGTAPGAGGGGGGKTFFPNDYGGGGGGSGGYSSRTYSAGQLSGSVNVVVGAGGGGGSMFAQTEPARKFGFQKLGDFLTWILGDIVFAQGRTVITNGGAGAPGRVTLTWTGGRSVSPIVTTTYTATMTGPTGLTGECQATVSLPPTCTLTLNPTSITPPQSSTLTWASQGGATSCTGTNFSTGGATAGNVSVAPSSPTTYTASCSNAAGSSQCTGSGSGGIGAALSVSCPISYSCTGAGNQTITRTNADCSTTNMTTCVLPQFCADTVDTCQIAPVSGSLTASPRIVASQSTSNLTWSTTNAVSCSVTGNSNTWTGLSSAASSCSPKSGSACVSNAITQFTTYTLVCDDADVDTTQDDFTATVNIYSVPTWTEL